MFKLQMEVSKNRRTIRKYISNLHQTEELKVRKEPKPSIEEFKIRKEPKPPVEELKIRKEIKPPIEELKVRKETKLPAKKLEAKIIKKKVPEEKRRQRMFSDVRCL
jgi:hypothetical protein